KSWSTDGSEPRCVNVSCSETGTDPAGVSEEVGGAGEVSSAPDRTRPSFPSSSRGSRGGAIGEDGAGVLAGSGAATASNVPLHVGHLTFFPSSSSGTRSFRLHEGQSTMVDIKVPRHLLSAEIAAHFRLAQEHQRNNAHDAVHHVKVNDVDDLHNCHVSRSRLEMSAISQKRRCGDNRHDAHDDRIIDARPQAANK